MKQGWHLSLQIHFEIGDLCNVKNPNEIRARIAPFNMNTRHPLFSHMLTQVVLFFKEMSTSDNRKTEDNFMDSGSKTAM